MIKVLVDVDILQVIFGKQFSKSQWLNSKEKFFCLLFGHAGLRNLLKQFL